MKINKIAIKIITIITILIISCTTICTLSFAENYDINDLVKGNNYDPNKNVPSSTKFTEFAGKILGAISVIGAILTVVLIAVIGFQYITGSSQDIAEIKSKFGGILIGVVMLTGATAIVRLVLNVM